MKHLKSEAGILIIGTVLVVFGSMSLSNNKSSVAKSKRNKTTNNISKKLEHKDKKTLKGRHSNKPNSRLPANSIDNSNNSDITSDSVSILNIKQTLLCLKTEDCNYSNNDPREYGLEVYQDVSKQIKKASSNWLKNWVNLSSDQKQEVINLIKLDSGYVKEDILKLINNLPIQISKEYYSAVAEGVLTYHDANLIPETVEYLKNIKTEENEQQIALHVAKTIENGSPLVAAELAKHSQSFINEKTRSTFKKLSNNLPEESSEGTFIEAALIEHDMTVSGG